MALGVLVFIVNVVWSRRRGAVAGANPWGAGTLEWAHDLAAAALQLPAPADRPGPRARLGEPAETRRS